MTFRDLKYLLLITVVFIAACIETDIYLPAFADMMAYFGTSEDQIQSLLTWNFVGICLSGPFYGPISDSIGRKKPLLFALCLFLLGSIITIYADSFEYMLWGRFLQGLGSGGCFTLGTAIIFDAFQAEKAVVALSYLNSSIPFIMSVAPMLGGYLNLTYGFRANFFAIALFVLLSLIICIFYFSEPLDEDKRSPFQIKKVLHDFKRTCTSLPFWQLTIAVSLMFAGYIVFLSGTAVLFVIELGVSKQDFPYYQAALLLAWLLASITYNRVLTLFGNYRVKVIGTALLALGGITLLMTAIFGPKDPLLLTGSMLLYTVGCNWTQGLYFPECMELFPDIKGITASLITSGRLLFTSLVVALSSAMYNATIYPIVGIIVGIVAIIVPLLIFYERANKGVSKATIPAQSLIH